MAKIGKDVFTIKTVWTPVEIHYNQKRGFFYQGLPDEFVEMMEWNQKRFTDESSLKTGLYCALTEYHERIKNTRKVIVYRLYGSSNTAMNKIGNGTYSGIKNGVSKKFQTITNSPDFCFGIEYDVLLQVSGKETKYHNINPDGTSGTPARFVGGGIGGSNVIDWSQEREDFCKALADKVQQLVFDVSSFFDKPNMLQMIDSGGAVLLETGSPSTDYTSASIEEAAYEEAVAFPIVGDTVFLPCGEEGEVILIRDFPHMHPYIVKITKATFSVLGEELEYKIEQFRSWKHETR